uniref:VWFD domain-containing protein n=1 Tax=Sphaeramia orbicularis TaxID=375764 RepID=A0A673C073_9TELE
MNFILEIPCPANSHFESQGTGCPATCVNPNSTQNCPLPAQESCICNSGYILSGGNCVPHAQCGCSFEGNYYHSGETVILDQDCGRQCNCSYGSMSCQPYGCGPLESCKLEEGERGCRPNSFGTCWIRGPGSYQTFDGLTYQYPGACQLTLAKVMGMSSHPHFVVSAEKVPQAQQGFARVLKFEAQGTHVSIEMSSHICGTSCPSTCPSLSFPFSCNTPCQEGCQCDDGFVLNGNQCVPPTGCGCHHQGRYRQGGEQFWAGDECQSLCSCNGTTGIVHCVPNSCGAQESCRVVGGEYGCHPSPHGTCSASGDPHYLTFDRNAYDFQGTCRYVLATLCNDTTGLHQFSVEARNEAWRGLPVSITAEVFVNVWGYRVHMSRQNHGVVKVDGITKNLPLLLDGGLVSIYASGLRTFVDTDFGLSVSYDGRSTVSITVPSNYRTCGLCGNFNGNRNDDFMTPSEVVVTSPSEFGTAWKVEGNYSCSDGCGTSCPQCTNDQPARAQCEVITAADGPLSFCHQQVDPTPYFNDCVYDFCVSENQGYDLVCRSIQAYVSACQSANVRIYAWRQNTTCSKSPTNSHYDSIDATCEHVCSEGCFCDEGFLRSGTGCVPAENCGCQYDGSYYSLGDSFWSDSTCAQKCTCTSSGLQCQNQPCTFSQICQRDEFQFSCQAIQRRTCTISGDPHYYTFDGAVFHFQGTCTYILSEQCGDGQPYYRVEGSNEHRGSTHVSWTRLVKVFVYNETIELVKGRRGAAKVSGYHNNCNIQMYLLSSILFYESGFSVTISTVFGLVVSYDAYHHVKISVPYGYQNKTCGLCGDFNSHPEDDFRTRQGVVVSSDVVFANSWKAPGEDDDGCGTGCGGLGCASCTDAQTALYGNSDHCGILQNSSGPFAACHEELPPQNFVESCVFDLCVGRGYQPILCQALSAYASQCQQNGVQLPSWRRQGFCEIPCPANSHFESQGTGCPATCVNPNSTQNCPLPAQESCICNSGYILSGGNCVPHAQCGCSFEGNYYHSGETVILDQDCGRRCNCSYGSMSCQPYGCGPLESCRLEEGERGCRPNSFGTCWIRGPGSYQTFDGLTYQYPGACQLTLAKVMGMSSHPHFVVSAEKVPQAQQGFARVLKFEAQGTHVSIEMSSHSRVDGHSIHSIVLHTSFGVTVQTVWPHFVRITAPVVYSSSIGGLCGNFNGHPHDDFRTPNGILVNSSQAFGDSWRDGSLSAHCVETMDHNNETNFNTTEHCGLLALSGGPFSACWDRVNPWQQVDVCVEILRSSANPASALCEVFRDYALMCQQKGVTLGHWRNATGCELTCPSNSHYEVCGDSCPSTCPSLSFPFSCNTPCQEGCQCDDGFVLNGNQCVPPTGCGCHHQGRYRQGGEQFWVGDECQSLCSCDGITGLVHCVPNSCGAQESCRVVGGEYGCHPSPHGTCSASGDPHYLTFDRNAYDFQGTCRYVLATLCNDTTGLHQFSVEARNEAWRGLPVSITAEVFVNVWGYRVHMSRQNHGVVKVDGITKNLPLLLDGGLVSIYASGLRTFVDTDFGLSVSYDGRSTVSITVPSNYRYLGRTCGLCGNFNGNRNDDFMTPSGVVVTSPSEFGTAWKVVGNYSCSDGCGTSCPQCTNDQPARAQCEVITAADGPLSFCHQQVDPTPYFNDCVYDFCVSENQGYDLVCRSIQAYVSACQSANVRIYAWRQNTTCIDCPANSHYELCGTDCGHTCASSIDATCEHVCSEGCFCDEGFLRSGTGCVPAENCGCQYDGSYYSLGDSFWSDSTCAQKCTCTSSGLQCQNQPCTFSQICQRDEFQFSCQAIQRRICTISGDPHYYTFDGAVFHFQGTCTYILSEQCGDGQPYYRVEGSNEHRGSTHVSWTRLVKVFVYNETIDFFLLQHAVLQVNGQFMTTPFFLNNGTVQVYESGFSVTISTVFGLVVSYDANHYVQISVPYGYQNKTCGLCGDFNNHPEDDFRTRQGVVVSSDVVFANSWKAPGEDDDGCGTGCGGLGCASCTDAQTALYGNSDHCGILQNSSGPFAACHEELPPQNFMESCVFDLCFGRGYQPILCQALSAYASQCQQNGVQLPSWRRQGFCEIPCPANSHFESQGTGCPATCVNPNSTQNCPLPAQESCICNSGYILSGGNCVPHAQCGCSFEGNYYHSGETVILDQDCGRQCNCSYGSMSCQPYGCGPLESCRLEEGERGCRPNSFGTCWIRGPGSYQTFDGLTYQYPGACQLTLAKVMGMSSHPHFVVSAEKVPQAQQGFARVLKFEAQGTHVSIEMSSHSRVQVSQRSTSLMSVWYITILIEAFIAKRQL